MLTNYKLPIKFNSLMRPNADLPACELKMSIAQNIYLIITSKYNEHRYDTTYGCEIYEMDFELILNENSWRDKIGRSIVTSISRHERRVDSIDASVDITEEEFQHPVSRVKGIRKKIGIVMSCIIKETGEPFNFKTQLYLGPISSE